jgi:hypothetical protein
MVDHAFIPASLAHLSSPPTFQLRTGTHRERAEFRSILRLAGYRQHAQQEHRAALLGGLRKLLTPDELTAWQPVVQQWWAAADDLAKRADEPLPMPEGGETVAHVLEQIAEQWPRCRALREQDEQWAVAEPAAIRAVTIIDVENLPGFSPARSLSSTYLTLASATDLGTALTNLAHRVGIAKPGKPLAELDAECSQRLFLGRLSHGRPAPLPSKIETQRHA